MWPTSLKRCFPNTSDITSTKVSSGRYSSYHHSWICIVSAKWKPRKALASLTPTSREVEKICYVSLSVSRKKRKRKTLVRNFNPTKKIPLNSSARKVALSRKKILSFWMNNWSYHRRKSFRRCPRSGGKSISQKSKTGERNIYQRWLNLAANGLPIKRNLCGKI